MISQMMLILLMFQIKLYYKISIRSIFFIQIIWVKFILDFETNESFSICIDLILFHQFKGQKLKLKNLLEVLLKSNQLISSKCFQQQILQMKMKMKMKKIKQWNKPNKLKCNKNENKMKKVLDLNFSSFLILIFILSYF